MSLKLFFMSLTEDELEFMCHNYVHNWINEELQKSNRLLSKYQVEQKLDYIRNKSGAQSGLNTSRITNKTPRKITDYTESGLPSEANMSVMIDKPVPRYMEPTIGKVKKLEEQYERDGVV